MASARVTAQCFSYGIQSAKETFRPEKKLNGLADARVVDETAEFPTQKTWLG
jgi:hypothetical protein